MGTGSEKLASCLACGEKLHHVRLLVCAECLGEGCELFLKNAETLVDVNEDEEE